ncbi:hATC-domain-containing protein [Polyporus arcularius HHB13444]|uniref:HATC-domain-containing protein n=1 Tax=Polyporus arcularius HHB13444 TaxID=1314778 RepID=A0A5C3NWD7_9APHY|nr:hATC-domain-containing protein [Polyporus arcularius HHB13444]
MTRHRATRQTLKSSNRYVNCVFSSPSLVDVPSQGDVNIFDKLDSLSPPQADELRDELERYLSADPEHAPDPIQWWIDRAAIYPNLSRMALDYLSIPATSVDVERVFSRGRLLLSHIRNRLSAQSTRALLCLGAWSDLGLIKAEDVQKASQLAELDAEDSDFDMEDGWDTIRVADLKK